MNGSNLWIENKVAELLRWMRHSQFRKEALEEARYLHRTKGYQWDVALQIAYDYWIKPIHS